MSPEWLPRVGTIVRIRAPDRSGSGRQSSYAAGFGRVVTVEARAQTPYCTVARCDRSDVFPTTAYWLHELEPFQMSTFRDAMERQGITTVTFSAQISPDPDRSFKQFCLQDWDDLRTRKVGNAADLMSSYHNAVFAGDYLRELGNILASKNEELPPALNFGSTLVLTAAQTVNASILLHLRQTHWYQNATLARASDRT